MMTHLNNSDIRREFEVTISRNNNDEKGDR